MKTLLLLLIATAAFAQSGRSADSVFVKLDWDSMMSNHSNYPEMQPTPVKQPTTRAGKFWDGIYIGSELTNCFEQPFETEFAAYGHLRLNLAQDLLTGLKVSFGTTNVVWRVNLEKKLF